MKMIICIKNIFVMIWNVFIEIFSKVFNFIVESFNVFLEIMLKLDCADRLNIYIGVTGILVAIVIFIAEIISNKKNELYQKLILEKTNILKDICIMIVILGVIWMCNLIEDENSFIYKFIQILINILIFYSMYKTYKTFKIALKLNCSEEYLNKELDNYVYKKIKQYENNKNKDENTDRKLYEEFKEYVNNSDIYKVKTGFVDINEEYNAIYPDEDGYIKKYNYNTMNYILKGLNIKLKANDIENITEVKTETPEIILCRGIGDKIDKRFPIVYSKNLNKDLIQLLKRIIIYDTKKTYYAQDTIKMLEELFIIAKQNKLGFDNTNQLVNLYEILCNEKYNDTINIMVNIVENMSYEHYRKEGYNKSFSRFLVKLLIISLKKNRIDDFRTFNLCITGIYCNRIISEKINLKKVAYEYANHVFIPIYSYLKRKNDYIYYDNIMSNLLVLINAFIKINAIEEVKIIFDNIYFENTDNNIHIDKKDLDKKEILNFQFFIGIIKIILSQYTILKNKSFNEIRDLLEQIKHNFIGYMDIWSCILYFKKYNVRNSDIMRKADNIEVFNEDHTYRNSWSWSSINDDEILKWLLYILRIDDIDTENVEECDIQKDDRFYLERIYNIFSDNKYEKLENVFDVKSFGVDNVKNVLSKAIDIANDHEERYKRECKLDEDKKAKFKKLVIEKSKEKVGILETLYELERVKTNTKKLKKVFGINQLIPREIFFNEIHGMENIASNYGRVFPRGINREVIQNIQENCEEINTNLETKLKEIKNLDDYIFIMNFHNFYTLNLEKTEGFVKFNNKKIKVVRTNDSDKILLVRKNTLPEIVFCEFDEEYDSKNIFGNIYYNLEDCSENEELRNKIMSENDWIMEIGSKDEQINYLKQLCDFQAFMSYEIINKEPIEGFVISEEYT